MGLPFITLYIELNVLIFELEDVIDAYLHKQLEWEQDMIRDYHLSVL